MEPLTFSTYSFSDLRRLSTEANYFNFLRKEFSHQTSWIGARYMYDKIERVLEYEQKIDLNKTLYLFTWAPAPDDLPDCDFDLQHQYNLGLVASFLNACEVGLACVESSQMGRPHYHGWYQLSDNPLKEKVRIAIVKTMQRFAPRGLKITQSHGHIKIGSWSKHANCLYYYKKDLLGMQLFTLPNPITPHSTCSIDWAEYPYRTFFNKGGRETVDEYESRISLREFYEDFYKKSD